MKIESTPLRSAEPESLGFVSKHQRTVIGDPWNEDFDPLADTLPPTPAKELLRAEGVEIYALSSDPQLLATLQTAAGERYPLTQTASFNQLLNAVQAGRCSIVIVDADPVSESLKDQLSQLCSTGHPLVLMLATSAEQVEDLEEHLAEAAAEPLLVKPCSPDFLRMRLTWALGRYFQLQQQPPPPIDVPSPQPIIPARRPWLGIVAITLSVVAIAAALVAWVQGDFRFDSPNLTTASTAVGVPEEFGVSGEQTVPPSLDPAAGSDTPAGALTNATPPGDIKLDVPQPAAREALSQDSSEAAQKLGMLMALIEDLDPETLDRLPSLLERERQRTAAQLAAAAAPAAAAAAAAEPEPAPRPPPVQAKTPDLDPIISLVAASLAEGRLVEPLEDSAVVYFGRAEAIAPGDPRLTEVRDQLIDELRLAAYTSLETGDLNTTELFLNEATAAGASAEVLGDLEIELSAARREDAQRAALIDQVRALLAAGQLLRPLESNAWSALGSLRTAHPGHPDVLASVAEFREQLTERVQYMLGDADWSTAEEALGILSELGLDAERLIDFENALLFGQRQAELLARSAPLTEFALVNFQQPEYPRRAVRRGIEGWVELSFVVNEQGIPEAIMITAAEPTEVFDDAVLAAVSDYRFEPHQIDGQIYRRAARTRVSFELVD